jgi:Glycosyl hydrolase family 62
MNPKPTILMAAIAIGSIVGGCGAGGSKLPDAARGTSDRAGLDASDARVGLTGGTRYDSRSSMEMGGAAAQGGGAGGAYGGQPGDEDGGADANASDGPWTPEVGMEISIGTGGAGGSGGKTGTSCPFPTSFKWTSSGPLAEPRSPRGHDFVSLKDFTAIKWKDQFIVFASVYDTKSTYSGVGLVFSDWSNMASTTQTWMETTPAGATVAPTLIYFTPKNQWVMTFQWGFKYTTSSDPTQPSKWAEPKSLFASKVANSDTGPIDQTVICDTAKCYLFFTATNGNIYRSSMPIGNFPGTFPSHETVVSESREAANEAVQVYAVKGTGKYLMIVSAFGARGDRYFRAYSADNLGGRFTAMSGASSEATPFAGKNNVTFDGSAWTNDIGEGDVVREDPSETQTIDPCKMQFLYQGVDPSKTNVDIGDVPYRPGLLTLVR